MSESTLLELLIVLGIKISEAENAVAIVYYLANNQETKFKQIDLINDLTYEFPNQIFNNENVKKVLSKFEKRDVKITQNPMRDMRGKGGQISIDNKGIEIYNKYIKDEKYDDIISKIREEINKTKDKRLERIYLADLIKNEKEKEIINLSELIKDEEKEELDTIDLSDLIKLDNEHLKKIEDIYAKDKEGQYTIKLIDIIKTLKDYEKQKEKNAKIKYIRGEIIGRNYHATVQLPGKDEELTFRVQPVTNILIGQDGEAVEVDAEYEGQLADIYQEQMKEFYAIKSKTMKKKLKKK